MLFVDGVQCDIVSARKLTSCDDCLVGKHGQYTNRDGTPLPMLIRKSDGGFNYATTDMAAIRQRVLMDSSSGGEQADRVLYVTDSGQAQHFEMVFQELLLKLFFVLRLQGFVFL